VSRQVLEKAAVGKTTVTLQEDHVWKFMDKNIDLIYISVNSHGSDDC
jgi:hypothetical protein